MIKLIAFALVVAAFLGLFVRNLTVFVKVAALGRPAKLEETWGERIASLMTFFFGQRKVVEEKRSWHHLALYWGFLVLQIGLIDMMITGLFGEFGFTLANVLTATGHAWLKFIVDIGNAVVAGALIYAFIRRLVIKPTFVPASLDAMLILSAITLIVITHFGHHVYEMVHAGMMEDGAVVSYALGNALGLYSGPAIGEALPGGGSLPAQVMADPETAKFVAEAHWWGHFTVVLAFLNYLPFSKHIHVLGSGPNILLRRQGQRGIMPKLELMPPEPDEDELEDEDPDAPPPRIPFENWGVGRIEDFDWKSLLDNYACTECARCTSYCPAFATHKPLSPMHLIHDLKDEMKARGSLLVDLKEAGGHLPIYPQMDPSEEVFPDEIDPEDDEDGEYEALAADADKDKVAEIKRMLGELPPLVGGRVKDETLWACTTCGACEEVCPVFIQHPLKILQMRTRIVLNDEEGRTPGDVTRVIGNIADGQGNPWNDNSDRMAWAEGLDVPTLDDWPDDKPQPEWLLFVGCAGALDDGAKKTTQALVRILHAAEVDFAVLGKQEKCTGDTLRRLGAEDKFQELAQEQVENMNEHGITKVIATCPHCFHVIKNEYPQFGGDYEVIHHSELIAKLLAEGKLKAKTPLAKTMTYHDSCYLGRWNQVYDSPREVVRGSLGAKGKFVELGRNREHGFCCGAGGGRMWVEEEKDKRVNVNRSQEIVDAGVDAVAVGCPFCKTMISDGMKHFDKDEDIEVLDIAQVVAQTLPAE